VRSIRCEKLSRNYPSPEVSARFVRIRLLMNILSGKDAAAQSAKLLGQDREVNLFGAEARVGISSFLYGLALDTQKVVAPVRKEAQI
jgi:hypothetical protein